MDPPPPPRNSSINSDGANWLPAGSTCLMAKSIGMHPIHWAVMTIGGTGGGKSDRTDRRHPGVSPGEPLWPLGEFPLQNCFTFREIFTN